MNKDKIKKILDKTDIYVLDEINILEYIDELEKVKEDYIKSLDKLDVLDNRIDKAIEYMEQYIEVEDAPINERIKIEFKYVIDILRGKDNESN